MGHSLNIPDVAPTEMDLICGEHRIGTSYAKRCRERKKRKAQEHGLPDAPKYVLPDMTLEELAKRQCIMRSPRTQQRCGSYAARGSMICDFHLRRDPMARAAAKDRLARMCEPAMAVLEDLMTSGVEDEVRLRAALAVLDRAGYSPKMQLTVKDKREHLDEMNREELFARGRALAAELESRRTMQRITSAVDAEIVGDGR